MSRRRRERETPEISAMTRRMIRALGRRLAEGDPVDLDELASLHKEIDAALTEAVKGQRQTFTWAEIAAGLGTTRQAAWERFR